MDTPGLKQKIINSSDVKEKLKNATEQEKAKLEKELQHQKDSILLHYQNIEWL